VDKGRTWDAVIDTSAYLPADMRASTTLLSKAVKHYVLVATVNVYRDDRALDQDETGPVHEEWNDAGEITPEQYGPMKRGCEVELEKLMPGRSCSVRPALIAGPRDPSDRFSY
jgi:2'-hydroxyisoflavone reductase